ncbi:MAG: 4-hydroxybenzoate polyprenyltransferase [Helicobacteraceae bacterium]|jgi:4-hydroxybenzoate polyprenyltransferase|nr:4-hydroxybenzoate polyprenyltransferase [Helicobacteraceae bacterium]
MNIRQRIRDLSEFVVFEHTVFSTPFIFIAMIVASRMDNGNGWFGFYLLLVGAVAAVSARNFAMAFNRLADRHYDALNPRTANRPSVDGRLSVKTMTFFVVCNALLFVGMCSLINTLALMLSVPFLAIMASYSYVKRFSWAAHLVLGLSLGLAPIAGAVAVLGAIPLWSLLLSAGVTLWVAGFDLLYALMDQEFDRQFGLFSIPAKFGVRNTLIIARLFHGIALLFWLFFCLSAQLGGLAWLGVCVSGAMLIAEHKIASRGMEHINRAFFTINGYLGVVFFIFIVLDTVWTI